MAACASARRGFRDWRTRLQRVRQRVRVQLGSVVSLAKLLNHKRLAQRLRTEQSLPGNGSIK